MRDLRAAQRRDLRDGPAEDLLHLVRGSHHEVDVGRAQPVYIEQVSVGPASRRGRRSRCHARLRRVLARAGSRQSRRRASWRDLVDCEAIDQDFVGAVVLDDVDADDLVA